MTTDEFNYELSKRGITNIQSRYEILRMVVNMRAQSMFYGVILGFAGTVVAVALAGGVLQRVFS
jgi:hypothetical protein